MDIFRHHQLGSVYETKSLLKSLLRFIYCRAKMGRRRKTPLPSADQLSNQLAGTSISANASIAKKEQQKEDENKRRKEKRDAEEARRKEAKRAWNAKLEEWASQEKYLASFQQTPLNDNDKMVQANFFEITLNNVNLRKYRIDLKNEKGEEGGYGKNARRYFIEKLLAKHPPKVDYWVTDFFSKIVSVGPLFKKNNEVTNTEYQVPHESSDTPRAGQPDMRSVIIYEGPVQRNELQSLVHHTLGNVSNYRHDDDTNALNVISWKNIIQPRWKGVRVGRKFYPQNENLKSDITTNVKSYDGNKPIFEKKKIYEARTGFFTSVRTGDRSLLLNVNATTSAFYPSDMTVQRWVERRWSGRQLMIPPEGGYEELLGLKVRRIGSDEQVGYYFL